MTKAPAPLPMTPIKSSMLSGYHHEPNSGDLTVTFKNGKRYRYGGVGVDKVETMAGAESPGWAFNELIRDRHTGIALD